MENGLFDPHAQETGHNSVGPLLSQNCPFLQPITGNPPSLIVLYQSSTVQSEELHMSEASDQSPAASNDQDLPCADVVAKVQAAIGHHNQFSSLSAGDSDNVPLKWWNEEE